MNTISPRQPAAISAASTGLAVRLVALCVWFIACGLFSSHAATIYQTNLLSQTGQPLNTEITFERWDPTPALPFPRVSNRIRNGVLFVPSIASGQYTVSHNTGTRALTYKIVVPSGSVTNTLTELAELVDDYVLSTGGAGSGSMTTVKVGGVQLGGADIVTLDFLAADFEATESPDTEINLNIAAGLTRDTEWDTIGEIETATGVNIIVASEIDTTGEINTLTTDDDFLTLLGTQTASGKTFTTPGIGNGATAGGHAKFLEDSDNGTAGVLLKAPDSIAADYTVNLPASAGTLLLANGDGSSLTGVVAASGDSATGFFAAGQVELARGGTGATLSDPNAHRLLGWDDTDGATKFLVIGSGLSYDAGTDTLSATGGGDAYLANNQTFTGRNKFQNTVQTMHDFGTTSGSITASWATNSYQITANGNVALTMSGSAPTSGDQAVRTLWFTQDGTGSRTLTVNGTSVTVNPTASSLTWVNIGTKDGGTTLKLTADYSATALATTDIDTSAELRAIVTDESGTGALIFAGGNIGAATATTPSANDNDPSVATSEFVQTELTAYASDTVTMSNKTIDADDNVLQDFPVEIGIAASDETTALTTGTAKVTFRAPYAFTLTAVHISATTAPTGATLTVDVNESGTTVLSTKVTIDASEKTSRTAATEEVISDSAIADDAEITIDIDQVGSTVAGAGLKVWLIGKRTF